MKRISAQTRSLVEQLNRPVPFRERLFGGRDDAELLSRVAAAGEPAALVDIAPFVLSEKGAMARAAAAAVGRLVAAASLDDLAHLDLLVRRRSPYEGRYGMNWHKLTPAGLAGLEGFGGASVALLGLASFHESGFVREGAVRRLDQQSSGSELPFLLLRLNDWVHNVRAAARQAVTRRLQPPNAGSLVMSLPLVARLAQAGRSDHREIVEAVESLLKRPACREALLAGLNSPDRTTRRISFRLAAGATGIDPPSILERALDEHDTVIRLWAARKAAAELEGETLDKLLSRMMANQLPPVRREALRAFVARLPEQAPAQLRRALLDPHGSVREDAQYHLRKSEGFESAPFYRRALAGAERGTLSAAIGGLGETGSASDDVLLVAYTHHPFTSVRRAALRALSKLNGRAHVHTFTAALRDEAPGVSGEARRALSDQVNAVGGETLREIFNSSPQRHVRWNVLHLYTRLSKWDSVYFLLEAAGDDDEEVAELSRHHIDRWLMKFNRGFTRPSREQLERIGRALEERGRLLDEKTREQLCFSVKGF